MAAITQSQAGGWPPLPANEAQGLTRHRSPLPGAARHLQVEWLRLEGGIRELFDVRVLPGVRCPMALPTFGPELARFVTIEAPDRDLGDRGWHPVQM
jgi:hypothetical protein